MTRLVRGELIKVRTTRTALGFGSASVLLVVAVVLLSTLAMTPVMTYVVLPRMTRALEWWLHGRPAPWRTRSL